MLKGSKKNSGSHAINWKGVDAKGNPEYSDHGYIIGNGILSWNIMNKCFTTSDRTNNGYGKQEDDNLYRSRLSRLARAISDIAKHASIDIIALQEVPAKDSKNFLFFTQELRKHLGNDFLVSRDYCDDTPGTASARLVIFNQTKYQVTRNYQFQLNGLGEQYDRIQIFNFLNLATKKTFGFANGHFAFGKDHKQAVNTLMANGMILAADMNHNVAEFAHHKDVQFSVLNGENFSYNVKAKKINPSTCYDAILVSRHLDGFSLAQTSPAQSAPAFNQIQSSEEDKIAIVKIKVKNFIQQVAPVYAAEYLYYQPPYKLYGKGPEQMAELTFKSSEAANYVLNELIKNGIVINKDKKVYECQDEGFYIPMGESELARLLAFTPTQVADSPLLHSLPSQVKSPLLNPTTLLTTQTQYQPLRFDLTRAKQSVKRQGAEQDEFAPFVHRALNAQQAASYISFKPARRQQMAELHFSSQPAANAFLEVLKEQNIVKNSSKTISCDARNGSYYVALGKGELENLKSMATKNKKLGLP